MFERVGVEDQPRRPSGEAAFERKVEEPRSDALADEIEDGAEEGYLLLVELEVAGQRAVAARDMQFVLWPGEQRRKGIVGKQAPLVPQPRPADPVVELAIERRRRRHFLLD